MATNGDSQTIQLESMPFQNEIKSKYDIHDFFGTKLNEIKGNKYVLLCDDSTSMNEKLYDDVSRWDELKETVKIVIEICIAYQVECEVVFLNRTVTKVFGKENVNIGDIDMLFSNKPKGKTPLTQRFNEILEKNKDVENRDVVIIVFTDGSPTSIEKQEQDAIKEFRDAIDERDSKKFPITLVACTDDYYAIEYFNKWDVTLRSLDIVDVFDYEREKVLKAKNIKEFSKGDYVAKIMMGSFSKDIDQIDVIRKCVIL